MKHARKDYDQRIVDLDNKIPEDEPVFLLRGQDQLAPELLLIWAMKLRLLGGDPAMAESAENHAQKMIKWQKDHKVKTPDMYMDGARRVAKEQVLGELELIRLDPKYYISHADKLSTYLKNLYDINTAPVLVIFPSDILPESANKKIEELGYNDINFANIDIKDYKVTLLVDKGNTYIIDSKV